MKGTKWEEKSTYLDASLFQLGNSNCTNKILCSCSIYCLQIRLQFSYVFINVYESVIFGKIELRIYYLLISIKRFNFFSKQSFFLVT